MEVPMEIQRLLLDDLSEDQEILLREKNGSRVLSILIAPFEARLLWRALHKEKIHIPRPLTHNLIQNCIKSLGGWIEKLIVTEIKNYIFLASLIIQRGDQKIEVDCRPSDGLILCVWQEAPIFAEEDLLVKESSLENIS